jgi:hypothetical protein
VGEQSGWQEHSKLEMLRLVLVRGSRRCLGGSLGNGSHIDRDLPRKYIEKTFKGAKVQIGTNAVQVEVRGVQCKTDSRISPCGHACSTALRTVVEGLFDAK